MVTHPKHARNCLIQCSDGNWFHNAKQTNLLHFAQSEYLLLMPAFCLLFINQFSVQQRALPPTPCALSLVLYCLCVYCVLLDVSQKISCSSLHFRFCLIWTLLTHISQYLEFNMQPCIISTLSYKSYHRNIKSLSLCTV